MTSPIGVLEAVSSAERALIQNLTYDGQTIVDVSSAGTEWTEAVLAKRQNIRALLYASPQGERDAVGRLGLKHTPGLEPQSPNDAGLRLDEDAAAEAIPHIHYLHIGNSPLTRHVLRGAQSLLTTGQIDFVQLSVDTHDFLTGQALMERLAESHYDLFEIETREFAEIRLSRYLIFNPNRAHTRVSLLAIQERLVRKTSLLLLQSALEDRRLQLPESALLRSVV
jgi:hypothetical protein